VRIAGIVAGDDRDAVPLDQLQAWANEGLIDFLGPVEDVRPLIAEADCVLLPSYYREGVPRALLEAAASARPVITTDWPGCREALDDGVTGFLCEPRSSDSLADAMRRMMNLEPAERQAMGRDGRTKMEREFSEELVIRAYLDALGEFASSGS
jgi:glycosyltransferase involved in cell wall biosynthesis